MGLTRSEVMSRIQASDTGPEEHLRKALWKAGLRYRKNLRIGRILPDAVFPGKAVAVFVDGCFWHGCPDHYVRPRTGGDFWKRKLRENVDRDIRQTASLESMGWSVVRFWEHEVLTDVESAVERIRATLSGVVSQDASWRVRLVEPLEDTMGAGPERERREMVELREPGLQKVVEQYRTTAKW